MNGKLIYHKKNNNMKYLTRDERNFIHAVLQEAIKKEQKGSITYLIIQQILNKTK